jgi:superfamily II DNA or RNA helicase
MSYDIKNTDKQYVNLKINGRLFPTWLLANFKKYKLPEILIDGSDPCNDKILGGELRKYQEIVGKYMDYNSPYRDILLYHGLGSGKTRSAINIYNILYNYTPEWNVFVLLRASLKESTWIKELDHWLQSDEKEFRKNNIQFISYDAPNADKIFLEKIKNSDSSKKSMYIVEECHNFIRNVYSNLTSKQGRRALTIYEHILQDKKDNDNVRVIMISGTPAVNVPFELALLFNLLRPNIFPTSEVKFNEMFVSNDIYPVLKKSAMNNFQRRIIGLVSYYVGATPDYYPKKNINYLDVEMSDYQLYIYNYYEDIEDKIKKKMRSRTSSNYMSYTQQSCNFVFPLMSQGFSGETRPRPRDYKITEKEVDEMLKDNKEITEKDKKKYYKVNEYLAKTQQFVAEFDSYLTKKLDEDLRNKHTLANDIDNFKTFQTQFSDKKNYDSIFKEFVNNKEKKSELFKTMYNCSAKILLLILIILDCDGTVQIYSNNVVMEGFQIIEIYLKYFGFSAFINPEKGHNKFRFVKYYGGIDQQERSRMLDVFNKINNVKGDIIKIIMISPAGSEGLNLANVRQVHILEPFWNETRIVQMIGRAIRQCSHKALPMNERIVDVYRYKSIKKNSSGLDKWTTDQYKEELSRSKEGLIQSFLDAIKSVAIDCVLNKAHNFLVGSYKCFQFEEKSLFDTNIAPAFKDDIDDDKKLNSGLNSDNSKTTTIKVIKIKAVMQLVSNEVSHSENIDNKKKYSEPEFYWYNEISHVVYDIDLQYPIGKVGVDDDNIPFKLDNETYIITNIIPIPIIRKQ